MSMHSLQLLECTVNRFAFHDTASSAEELAATVSGAGRILHSQIHCGLRMWTPGTQCPWLGNAEMRFMCQSSWKIMPRYMHNLLDFRQCPPTCQWHCKWSSSNRTISVLGMLNASPLIKQQDIRVSSSCSRPCSPAEVDSIATPSA